MMNSRRDQNEETYRVRVGHEGLVVSEAVRHMVGTWGQKSETPEGSIYTPCTTLETTQGQTDAFFSQLPFKYYLPEVASVGD